MAKSFLEKYGVMLTLVVVVVGGLYVTGNLPLGAVPTAPGAPPSGPGYVTTLTFSTLNKYAGLSGPSDLSYRIFKSDGSPQITETQVTANPQTQGTMPNTFDGFVFIGNDNYLGTDRGQEIYYTKKTFSYVNDPAPNIGTVDFYNESTCTIRIYDSGTEESIPNITMATGATYTRLEVEIEAGDNACIGNPDFKKLAFAWNCTNTTVFSKFDEIRPKSGYYTGTDTLPEFLAGRDFGGSIYILNPQSYVCDYGVYRFPIVVDAKAGSDPTHGEATGGWDGDNCAVVILDWSYFIDDNQRVASGWEDKSDIAADTDVGINSLACDARITFM